MFLDVEGVPEETHIPREESRETSALPQLEPDTYTNLVLHAIFAGATAAGAVAIHEYGKDWPTPVRRVAQTALGALSLGSALHAGSDVFHIVSVRRKQQKAMSEHVSKIKAE